MSSKSLPEFGKVRAALWPIHNFELKKFLPMGLIMFFILFNYTILRDTKDVLIITAPQSGAEVLSFLKGWGVMPSAILFVVLYAKLTNIFAREKLFYGIVAVFVAFFGLFALYLYPNKELIHPSIETIQHLQQTYPRLQWVFPIYGVWTYSIFYILSELWGSVMVSLLFWQFANEITRTDEAKRFYALFSLIANVSLIFSGWTVRYFSQIRDLYPPEVDAWGISLNWMMGFVVISGFASMFLYWWMNNNVLTDTRYYDAAEASKNKEKKKSKPKLGVMESFKYIFTSPYLGLIAILVMGYGISINLIEVVWKNQIKIAYPNPNDYGAFMGAFSSMTGLVTIILILFTKGIVRKFGWFTGAIITPLIVVITGGMFFSFIFFNEIFTPMVAGLGLTSTLLAAWIGAVQNFLSKGTKYSLFDPTKEMAYIPLDQELKVKGKAAVDVIGGRLGKATGGYTIQALLILTKGRVDTITPYLASIIGVVVIAWIFAVKGLNKRYQTLVATTAKSK
jgi:AAA family ATP:ADP antiporter